MFSINVYHRMDNGELAKYMLEDNMPSVTEEDVEYCRNQVIKSTPVSSNPVFAVISKV